MSTTPSSPNVSEPSESHLEIKMGLEVRSLGIPPRPMVLQHINEEMLRPEPDFTALAEIIAQDVALSAGIVKVANTSYFGFSKAVRSVQEALLVLGLNTITHAIAGMELQKAFQNVGRLERFWDSSAVTAHMSAWIAQRINSRFVRPVDAYTFGLFHDCGIPLLLAPFKEYVSVLEKANSEDKELFTDVEDHYLSINHAAIGAQLAKEWLLPMEIAEAILHHHNPHALMGECGITERSRHSIAIAQMAEHFHNHHTGLSKSCEWEKLGGLCLKLMGISPELLEDLYRESAEVIFRKAI